MIKKNYKNISVLFNNKEIDWTPIKRIAVINFNKDQITKKIGLDLEKYLKRANTRIFGTFMEGKNVYSENLPQEGILILGNEANGISEKVEKLVTTKLAIPRFGALQQTESLNVATATAIFLSEFKRTS
jgi:tRNA G18 (ribose-2'-O)-methylase SpoU